MAENSAEGNKAETARYRARLAARDIRPVQLYVPKVACALLRQRARLRQWAGQKPPSGRKHFWQTSCKRPRLPLPWPKQKLGGLSKRRGCEVGS